MNTSVFSLDIWLQFALITRILPFQTSLPIALLTGDWLLRNMAGPNIVYLPDKHNIIADALSCLPKLKEPHDESTFHEEIFAFHEQLDVFPIAFNVISKAQLANNKIQWSITNNDPDFETRIIQCAPLVYFKGKITFPANLHSCVLTWYHKNLLHPVTNWIFHTILQHFTWPSLCPQVENFIKHCNTCQHYKTQQKKYGHIPIQDTQQIANPWHSIAVNTIGWTMDHSTVATFFEIKRAYYTSSIYNHWSKHAFHGNCGIEKQGKHHHHLHPQPSLALPLPQLVDWWNLIQIDHCQKPSSQQYPQMHPSCNWKSLMFHTPCCSRPCHHLCPTKTSHACYVGHQHNIPYNLKGKPSSTCFQPWHDSSNFLCHQLICHHQLQTSSITICHWCQKLQMHSAWISPQWQSSHPLWHWKFIFG